MFMLLHLLIFYNLIIWKPCVSFYISETAGRMTGKLQMLCKELVIDAISKVESVQHFRRALYKTTQYQYGSLMYEMTYRRKKMFQLYTKVLDAIESTPVTDGSKILTEEMTYLEELAEMDSLCHEIINFAAMIQLHDANLHADKSKVGYDLFFRRLNVAPVWLGLLDSMDNNNPPEPPPEAPPEDHNLTSTGKRRNGVWHYAVPIE